MINISQIIEGWRNKLIPPAHLKEVIKKVSNERLEICKKCWFNSLNKPGYKTWRLDVHCTLCGCPLDAKTKCLSCSCELPIPEWTAVVSEEEEEELTNDK